MQFINPIEILELDTFEIGTLENSIVKKAKRKLYADIDLSDNESFEYRRDIIRNLRDIDVVITHTAPDWCYPNNKLGFGSFVEDWAKYDSGLIGDLSFERNQMTNVFLDLYENNKVKDHIYGHFHKSKFETHNGVNHRLLDINEIYHLYPY